jgi:hypothetical protein
MAPREYLRLVSRFLRGVSLFLLLCHVADLRALSAQEFSHRQSFAPQDSEQQPPLNQLLPAQLFVERSNTRVPAGEKQTTEATSSPGGYTEHCFFDRENILLFGGVGASRTLDYFSTLNMRRRGRQEILLSNWVVDDLPLFAGGEAAGTALSIGASYLLHRTGHHRLERAFSMVHIGLATTGAVRNYSLKTFHTVNPNHQ